MNLLKYLSITILVLSIFALTAAVRLMNTLQGCYVNTPPSPASIGPLII